MRLTRVPAAGYELRLTPSHSWLEFRRLDTSCGWLRPTADWSLAAGYELQLTHPTAGSSPGGWTRLKTDSILHLTRVPAAWYELQLILSCGWLEFYTLIYQVNLRTYSAKYIIFMVCFILTDFSYHWSRLLLLLQEPWKTLRKLEETSRP